MLDNVTIWERTLASSPISSRLLVSSFQIIVVTMLLSVHSLFCFPSPLFLYPLFLYAPSLSPSSFLSSSCSFLTSSLSPLSFLPPLPPSPLPSSLYPLNFFILFMFSFSLYFMCVDNLRWHRRNTNGSCYARFLPQKLPKTVLLRTAAHDFLPNVRVTHQIFFPLEQGPPY